MKKAKLIVVGGLIPAFLIQTATRPLALASGGAPTTRLAQAPQRPDETRDRPPGSPPRPAEPARPAQPQRPAEPQRPAAPPPQAPPPQAAPRPEPPRPAAPPRVEPPRPAAPPPQAAPPQAAPRAEPPRPAAPPPQAAPRPEPQRPPAAAPRAEPIRPAPPSPQSAQPPQPAPTAQPQRAPAATPAVPPTQPAGQPAGSGRPRPDQPRPTPPAQPPAPGSRAPAPPPAAASPPPAAAPTAQPGRPQPPAPPAATPAPAGAPPPANVPGAGARPATAPPPPPATQAVPPPAGTGPAGTPPGGPAGPPAGARPPGPPPQAGQPPQAGAATATAGLPATPFSPGGARYNPRGLPGGFLPGLAVGAAAGLAAGAGIAAIRGQRQEVDEGGRTYVQEPGRIIVRDGGRSFIRHDEVERFRDFGGGRTERRGDEFVTITERPGGGEVVTVVDSDGRLLRRIRRFPDGREIVIIDNGFAGPPRPIYEDVIDLPPPPIGIPRERYVVEAADAPPELIYDTFAAPPLVPIERRYTLDQVRYSPNLRARMRSVDVDTINFDTGSWDVTADQTPRLAAIAQGINRVVSANPKEVFLIEGYTDAVGSDVDNLSLSDRRAASVAAVLTRVFRVPPENLTTQGYGEQYLKVSTQEASRENRRVTVRRITPLLDGQAPR